MGLHVLRGPSQGSLGPSSASAYANQFADFLWPPSGQASNDKPREPRRRSRWRRPANLHLVGRATAPCDLGTLVAYEGLLGWPLRATRRLAARPFGRVVVEPTTAHGVDLGGPSSIGRRASAEERAASPPMASSSPARPQARRRGLCPASFSGCARGLAHRSGRGWMAAESPALIYVSGRCSHGKSSDRGGWDGAPGCVATGEEGDHGEPIMGGATPFLPWMAGVRA